MSKRSIIRRMADFRDIRKLVKYLDECTDKHNKQDELVLWSGDEVEYDYFTSEYHKHSSISEPEIKKLIKSAKGLKYLDDSYKDIDGVNMRKIWVKPNRGDFLIKRFGAFNEFMYHNKLISNIFTGFVGALIGAIIGVVVTRLMTKE